MQEACYFQVAHLSATVTYRAPPNTHQMYLSTYFILAQNVLIPHNHLQGQSQHFTSYLRLHTITLLSHYVWSLKHLHTLITQLNAAICHPLTYTSVFFLHLKLHTTRHTQSGAPLAAYHLHNTTCCHNTRLI
jgi:hypothetical protein